MKITLRDLDNTILEKLNILDNVIKTYDEKHPDGFVSYGKNGFYFKKTNDTFLKKVMDEEEILTLENSLISDSPNILSSILTDFRADNKKNLATKSFLFKTPFTYKRTLSAEILHYKSLETISYAICADGCIKKITAEGTEDFNVINFLEKNFNLIKKIYPRDIVDFEILNSDTLIIATSNLGIYKIKFSEKTAELLCLVDMVRKIKITYTKSLFVLNDSSCTMYDLESGKKIESYYNLANRQQIPLDIAYINGDIFVLGIPTGTYNLDNLLHLWKLDNEKVAYNNLDSRIEKIKLDNRYQFMFISNNTDNVYLSGLFKDNPFIVKINIKELNIESVKIYEDLKLNTYSDFIVVDDKILILSENMVYVLNENAVEERMKLSLSCSKLMVVNGEFMAISNCSIVKFQLTEFKKMNDTLTYNIFNEEESCNNLDIFIKNTNKNETVILLDRDTNKEIPISYYVLYKGNAILKLMNCHSKNIVLKISVNESSNIEGIVIRKNKLFLR